MLQYQAPLQDIQFIINDVFQYPAHFQSIHADEATADLIEAIIGEAAKFSEQVLSPLNQTGDSEGCQLVDGQVKTPAGFKAAYQQWVQGGWPSLSQNSDFGGQGLPESIGSIISELVGTANWSWAMYPGLSHGAMYTIETHGSEQQQQQYLPNLISGEWTGTMCLTEPQCGTDLGLLKCKATPNADNSYTISGTKIFISSGDHDLAENIIHIVLARLPDAPKGTKGISLFIVPKLIDNQSNHVNCQSIENKMGIHANATCVLNFDDAQGFLIGEKNKGLHCMFTFMNFARLATAIQGIASSELSYQGALSYALDRRAMRAITGTKDPAHTADRIIEHADVRRMLLTQKAFAQGGRAMLYHTAQFVDTAKSHPDTKKATQAEDFLGLLTPIAKAFLTETGCESANLGIQVYGGHGFIKEWGMEQIVRDARIATLYEGTTGIQALDLLGRKILANRGRVLRQYIKKIQRFAKFAKTIDDCKPFANELHKISKQWAWMSFRIALRARKNRDEINAASVDYLMFSGYVVMAYMWLKMAVSASKKISELNDTEEKTFYIAKIETCDFYFKKLLPRAQSLKLSIKNGSHCIMDIDISHF